jgi:hypothetical protein
MQRRALWLIVGMVGSALGVLTCGSGLLLVVAAPAVGGALTVAETLPPAGIMALGLVLGVPLALHGWAGWRERPSRPFKPSHVWWLWLLLVALIGIGAVISSQSVAPALLLPPIHVVAMALLPLIVLALVGRALRGMGGSWREVVASVGGGGFLGMGVSLVGEGLVILAAIIFLAAIVAMMPGGAGRIVALARDLQDLARQADITSLLELVLSPVVVVSALAYFSIAVPLIEETCKTLAAGVVGCWVRPHLARIFLWGVAGGAGFALVENLLSGVLGGAEVWPFGVVTRFGATVMHCFTGGLVGWGWGQLWSARRPVRLLGTYAAAVIIHGLWNAAAVGAGLLGATTLVFEADDLWLALIGLGMATLTGALGLLAVAFLVMLLLAGRRLADEAEQLRDRGSSASAQVPAAGLSEISVP